MLRLSPFPSSVKKPNPNPQFKGQMGFTLVELVLAIIMVGVLAAVAAPRLLNLGKDARIATVQGLEGAVRSQVNLLQMKCMTATVCRNKINETGLGSAPLNDSETTQSGLTVSMVYGIPRHPTIMLSIAGLLNATAGVTNPYNGTMSGFSVSIHDGGYDEGGSITFQRSDAPDPTQCKVIYTPGKWGTDGWTAPWNSNYRGGGSGNLPTVPLDQRYNVSTTTTGC
jgi:MSHA pilin protein MshA